MSGPDFLDTNVLVYAYDANHPEKQRVARQLLKSGIAGKAVISTQVLAEFAATLLHKIFDSSEGRCGYERSGRNGTDPPRRSRC